MPRVTYEPVIAEELLTKGAFWDQYGEKSGFTEEQFGLLWDDAEQLYNDWPYHNFLHAREVLWECMEEVDRGEAEGYGINRKALIGAALYHDALFYAEEKDFGFDTKEELSASLFEQQAPQYGYTPEDTKTVKKIILCTTEGVKVETLEEKIMLRADLSNIAGEYIEDYLRKGMLFRDELIIRFGPLPIGKFVVGTVNKVGTYLSNELDLPWENPKDRQTVFKSRAVKNVKRHVRETARSERIRVQELLAPVGRVAMKTFGYKPNHNNEEAA